MTQAAGSGGGGRDAGGGVLRQSITPWYGTSSNLADHLPAYVSASRVLACGSVWLHFH